MRQNNANLLEDPIRVLYRKYLLPSISATLVTSIYILADTMMVGRGVGPVGIAALNLLLPVFSLFFGTGMMFGVGGSVLFSISRGRQEEAMCRRYFTAALVLALLTGIVYGTAFQIWFDPVTAFLGRNESMDRFVRQYGRILIAGAPIFVCSSFFQAFVRNDREPKRAMAAVIAGGVSNVILDYVFIFPLGMGMAGAAAATVIGSLITVVILLTHFVSPANTLKLSRHFGFREMKASVLNGASSFLVEMTGGIVIFLFNRQLLSYVGDLGVVVYGIVSNSALIAASIFNGISQAAQPVMAINFGAGKRERVEETRRRALKAAAAAGILFTAIGLFCPQILVYAFVEPTAEIMAMGVTAVRIYFLSFLAAGANVLFATYFQSVLKPGFAMAICLLRGIVLNGAFVFLLPAVFGVNGIWAAMTATECMTLLCAFIMLKGGRKTA